MSRLNANPVIIRYTTALRGVGLESLVSTPSVIRDIYGIGTIFGTGGVLGITVLGAWELPWYIKHQM